MLRRIGVFALAIVALCGQTAPPRHVTYAFETGSLDKGTSGAGQTVVTLAQSGVDTLRVQATDAWTRPWFPREQPQQTVTCEVARGGSVTCPNPPYGLSEAQRTLLPFLAPGFFDLRSGRTRRFTVREDGSDRTDVTDESFVLTAGTADRAGNPTVIADGTVTSRLDGVIAAKWRVHDVVVLGPSTGVVQSIHERSVEIRTDPPSGQGHLDLELVAG